MVPEISRLESALVLPHVFYDRNTVEVARDLIGCLLIHDHPAGTVGGVIVETEAYGEDDPSSHAYRGKTPRNAAMFGPPGTAYVYRSYGVHWCLNAVTGPEEIGEAVLLRAVEPVLGIEIIRQNRNGLPLRLLCAGPGRLCAAFGITDALNKSDLRSGALRIYRRLQESPLPAATPRIGISQAKERLWRFVMADSPYISRRLGRAP